MRVSIVMTKEKKVDITYGCDTELNNVWKPVLFKDDL